MDDSKKFMLDSRLYQTIFSLTFVENLFQKMPKFRLERKTMSKLSK